MGRPGKEINGGGRRLSSAKSSDTSKSTLDVDTYIGTEGLRRCANLARSAEVQVSHMTCRYIAGPIGDCHGDTLGLMNGMFAFS